MKFSQNRLAIEIGVDARRINEITLGTRSITADTALRLARYFEVSSVLAWSPGRIRSGCCHGQSGNPAGPRSQAPSDGFCLIQI